MFTLTFDTDNEAFQGPDEGGYEVRRILREVISRLENYGTSSGSVYDNNGNNIGSYNYTVED